MGLNAVPAGCVVGMSAIQRAAVAGEYWSSASLIALLSREEARSIMNACIGF